MPENYVITVGRSFGSGGHALAEALARYFGIAFYDKELLSSAAEKAGLSQDYFEQNDEREPRYLSGIFAFNMGFNPMHWYSGTSSISGDNIYKAQCDFIRETASKGPCVIVGRTADYVLRDMPNVVNIFVHAPCEECARRIMQRSKEPLTSQQAMTLAQKTNKLRANFYNFYSDKKWGRADSYHLCVDSSSMPFDELVEFVARFVRSRLGIQ
ncbi:MAG: cytidylate kinase-like family protein [Muribaculaceae bacterium]|nr:cytidylate kinase-like family protein [Muribaculaceae bacterium]